MNNITNENSNKEKEANMFAARVLMPICVLYECKVESATEIQKLCHVSIESAQYRFDRLQMLIKRNKFYTDKNEIALKKAFQDFIDNYKISKTK